MRKFNTFKMLLATSCFSLSMLASASCENYLCEGVTNTVITSIKTTQAGTFVTFPTGTDAALDCALINGESAVLEKNHPEFKSVQSLLVTAVASNLPIAIEFSSETSTCSISSVALKVAN